jgi:beta-phosphoglucomutase
VFDMKIKAILFDMDGVLIDAKDWHYESLNDALRLFGMEINYEEHLAIYDGLPTRKKLQILSRTRGLPEKLHEFINQYKQMRTIELVYTRCRPVFQHQYALSRLKSEGYAIAVCSNSIRSTVGAMMERAALDEYLNFYLSNEDVTKSKPDPEIYIAAAERLQLKPEECLIVEDNEHGIQAAIASGGHLLEVATVFDVTYDRIRRQITRAEQGA